jgi:hypothetical protein
MKLKVLARITVGVIFYLMLFVTVLPSQQSWTGDMKKVRQKAVCKDGATDQNHCKKHGGVAKWVNDDHPNSTAQPKVKNKSYSPNPPVKKAKRDSISKKKKEKEPQ